MKKGYSLIVLCMLIVLGGCGSRSSFPLIFDGFTIPFYDNGKSYATASSDTSIEGMVVLQEIKEMVSEGDTGFINSFFVLKTYLYSGSDIQNIVAANSKKYQTALFAYSEIINEEKRLKCRDTQYTGYLITFSYEVERELLYGGQYFFRDENVMYVLSYMSDTKDDIKRFVKSIKKIQCTQK